MYLISKTPRKQMKFKPWREPVAFKSKIDEAYKLSTYKNYISKKFISKWNTP